MPSVVCPTCLRRNRVRKQSLGRSVVCTYCGAAFEAEESGQASQEPLSYGPQHSGEWQIAVGLIVLVAAAIPAVLLLARSR